MFLDALSYPVRKGGWAMILTGAIFSIVAGFLQALPIVGIGVVVFGAGFFSGFYLDIVSATMMEDDRMPDWPSFTDFMDDIVTPLLRMIGLVMISFGPAVAVALLMDEKAPAYDMAVVGVAAMGCFYFPMAVLGSITCGNLFGALPHIVLPAMMRALPGYLVAVPGLVIAVAVCGAAEEYGGHIPYVGWLLAAAVSVYSLMMQARVIGLIYREKRGHLGWE